MPLSSVFDTCIPRREILSGDLKEEIFAAKIRPVVEGKAPQVYQDTHIFFANTFPTDGIKTLIKEAFGRLNQQSAGSPVIRLETSFGGGKTHDQIALWHIAKQGRKIQGLDRFIDLNLIPESEIQVAAIDGRDLDPENGIFYQEVGLTTYTIWGEIAYQIGGISGYELLKGSDTSGISPGTSILERLINGQPTVIIIDEIARYLRSAKAKLVGNSDLSKQVVAFLFSLMDLAAACDYLVLVYSLASAADTFAEETADLNELIQASARQERVVSPSTDVEIYNIVKQRLFEQVSDDAATAAAREYLDVYKRQINLPDACKDASYATAIAQSYPFHPELFKLLTQKIASIPEFQRTRGALRLFALVVQHLWQANLGHKPQENAQLSLAGIPMIHCHHIPVGVNRQVTDELTSRLQRPFMRNPIQADIYNIDGRKAYAQTQDEEWTVAGKPPFSSWVARTIFLHSLTQGISSGIREAELSLSLLTPDVKMGLVKDILDNLVKVAWYLDYDPITSVARFKEEPSLNKIISEEKEQVKQTDAKEELRKRRDTIFATRFFTLISGQVESPSDVDDRPDDIALCVMDFDDVTVNSPTDSVPELVDRIFQQTGESGKFRIFRNRLLFLLANKPNLQQAIDNAREYQAIKNILGSPNRLDDLSERQKQQLKEREGQKDLDVRISLTNTYRHLFYPANDPVKAPKGLMHYTLSAQDASMVKGKNHQQEVILKALKDCGKIRPEDAKPFAPAYILQKVWPAGIDSWTTKELCNAFAKDLSLNMFLDGELSGLRETIKKGLTEGHWDLKVSGQGHDRFYIQTTDRSSVLPDISELVSELVLEFSDRFVLYRRGILEPPKPRTLELTYQLMPSSTPEKSVYVRWKAEAALKVTLFKNEIAISTDFKPKDEYQTEISSSTLFKIVADYGNGETAAKEVTVNPVNAAPGVGSVRESSTIYRPTNHPGNSGTYNSGTYNIDPNQPSFWESQPPTVEVDGNLNRVWTQLTDRFQDYRVKAIEAIEMTVEDLMDYRKLGTAIALLQRFSPKIDQTVTIQTGAEFIRLEYQGDARGFQSFFSTLGNWLVKPGQSKISLKIILEFNPPISPTGSELKQIEQTLNRNPVERIYLRVNVSYS
jgi:hypothetical protein